MKALTLRKINATKATEICSWFKPQPEAQALLTPQQTPEEYLAVLEKNQIGEDAVKTLAHGMPARESTYWATQSAQKVSDKMTPADNAALQAAEAWVKNPSPATQAQAAVAAAKTDYQGPGAWAAQAAAWSQPAVCGGTQAPAAISTAAVPAQSLTPQAVAGAVMLSAAAAVKPKLNATKVEVSASSPVNLESPQLQVPEMQTTQLNSPQLEQPAMTAAEKSKSYEALKPFIELGKEIGSGRNSWPV